MLRHVSRDLEAEAIRRSTVRSDQIACERSQIVIDDIVALVPVRIELHPPLLHQYAAILVPCVEGVAGEIPLHRPNSSCA